MWEATTGELLATYLAETGWPRAVALSPAAERVAVLGEDGLRLWSIVGNGRGMTLSLFHERVGTATFSPDGARALTEEERFEIQRGLVARGHDVGGIDGVLGSKTRAAIRILQKEKGVKVDGFPTPKILDFLRAGG